MRLACSDTELAKLVGSLRDELGLVWELTSLDMWSQAAKKLRPYYAKLIGEELCTQIFPALLASRVKLLSTELPALSLPIQLTLLDAGLPPTKELLHAMHQMKQSAQCLADDLWKGADSLAQKLLFRAHAEDAEWPNLGLVQEALTGFQVAVTADTLHKVNTQAKSLFWPPTHHRDRKVDVANMPVICALWSVSATSLDWWSSKEKSLALKRIRAFDPLWFEASYRQAILMCMAMGIGQANDMKKSNPSKQIDSKKRQVVGRTGLVRAI